MPKLKFSQSRRSRQKSIPKTKTHLWVLSTLVLGSLFYAYHLRLGREVAGVTTEKVSVPTIAVLGESASAKESKSDMWWLNSGGQVSLDGKAIKTIQGELPANNKWRVEYATSNSLDTDNGYHPQNVFRLITRGKWQNFTQKVYFRITKDNLSKSPNRDRWSGVFLFNRYQDGDNLYYAGVRADGATVIKKKTGGVYYTMAYKKIYPGTYHRTVSPSLLPHNSWVGLKSEVENLPSGFVSIKLYLDKDRTGEWEVVLEVLDRSDRYGGPVISPPGSGGIRTDFMDVEFDNYETKELDV